MAYQTFSSLGVSLDLCSLLLIRKQSQKATVTGMPVADPVQYFTRDLCSTYAISIQLNSKNNRSRKIYCLLFLGTVPPPRRGAEIGLFKKTVTCFTFDAITEIGDSFQLAVQSYLCLLKVNSTEFNRALIAMHYSQSDTTERKIPEANSLFYQLISVCMQFGAKKKNSSLKKS